MSVVRLISRFLRPVFLIVCIAVALSHAILSLAQSSSTTIQVSGAVQQASVNRLGVNLSDQTYWDSGQMLKNLVFQNPGFEGLKYRVIFHCDAVTASTCTDDNQFNAQPTGFWNGGSYQVMTGNSAGATGTVVSSTNNFSTCAGCGPILQFDKALNLSVGDYFSVETYIPGSGDTGWWDDTNGGGTITTETTDLSPETPGKQALLLSASGTGKSVSVTQYFDSYSNLSFIQLNGAFVVTFRAKGVGGNNQLSVSVQRMSTGSAPYLSQTVTLSNSWQDYTLTFSANETGSAVGTVQLVFGAAGSNVELDDVAMQQTNSSTSNPTVFRDDVVNALKELNPGTIRMMASGAALGSDLPNQLQVPFTRYRGGFNADGTSVSDIAYGIHEFLQLCQAVGADPWITIPTATTPQEMTDFIEYLTGNGSDPWSALRIARGQSEPWTSVFGKIHLELGNETWNGIFKGESMGYPGYPQWANTVFGAARQTPGFEASQFDLILSGWAAVAGYNSQMLSSSTEHDSFDIAPYLLYSANNEAQSTMFGALFAEPELFDSAGGEVYQNMQAAAAAPSATASSTNLSVYETNLSPVEGGITQAQLNQLTPSVGAGMAHTEHMLQMMRTGVKYQNAFALPQYAFQRGDGSLVKLWGMVVDMGTTNRRRPQYLTQALANSVVGGNMLQTAQSGANPTWNQPLSSDSVVLNGAHYLQSFAFLNGNATSVVIFNLNQTTALPVTFSGENEPTGTVQMTQITSTNITDNNEISNVVQPTTKTLSAFNPATGLSLPPFSMTVLSWTSTFAQAPSFSVPAGTYSTTQTVALASTTAGATIYYTTNGSAPTTASTLYTGPITVSKTQTLNAIAVAANLATSPVATAVYTIQPVAASPVFSLATGTYNAGQTVTITDAVAGSTIYYTTNGSTPTTSSTVYSGPIAVSTNETLSAIAVAANYTNSTVATAVYTIAPPTATPVLSVAAGTYTAATNVQISDATPGAVIYYTTNGTTPTTASTRYSSYVTVSATETLKAIAIESGYSISAVASASYTIAPYAATPVLSVPGGTYSAVQTVALSDTTPGAKIYYTTNQATPTTSSTVYTSPITITGSVYLQAIAAAPGYTPSFIASGMYTVTATAVGTPILSLSSGTYSGTQTVTVTDATAGAVLYYTTNGATPTTGSIQYTGPITVSASETLQVIGTKSGYTNSAVASASYVIAAKVAATPVFSVAAGTYTTAQTVSITDTTAGAKIYYTTNGSTPTTSSSVYSSAITISASETLSAIVVATGYTNSAVATASYTITPITATPTFSVASGTYTSAQAVTLSDSTSGAKIYYTTNGTTPTTASTLYSGPITVGATETLHAIAVATGYSTSAVGTAALTITLPATAPVFSLATGTYASAQTVTISDVIPLATIYYTTNGTTPTTSSSVYTGPITVNATETVEAMAIAINFIASPVATATYIIGQTPSTTVIGYTTGFAANELSLNGSAELSGTMLQLVNGGTAEAGAAWYPTPVSVNGFTTAFDFQLPTSTADGFTFTIQNYRKGVSSLGANGSGLGYQLITNSVAVAFNLYASGVTNAESVGVYTNGVNPQGSSVNLAGTAVNLHSGDPFHVLITYSGTTLTVTLTDKTTSATVAETFTVNIPSSVGASTAYVGFTGSTGGFASTQNILDWTYAD